jgi:hypothetical protein
MLDTFKQDAFLALMSGSTKPSFYVTFNQKHLAHLSLNYDFGDSKK